MSRSGIPAILVLASLAFAGPAGAESISFVDLSNPPGHLYRPSDSVTIGVFIEGPLSDPVTQFNFHWSSDEELSLTGGGFLLLPGWSEFAYTGGTCDLLDPYGRCVGMYDPAGIGTILFGQQVATFSFDVVAVGSGEAVVGPLFAPADFVTSGGFDISPTFVLIPATIQIVPEPATFGTVSLGLAWIARAARRGRASRRLRP